MISIFYLITCISYVYIFFFQRNDGNISLTLNDEEGSTASTAEVQLFDVFSDQVASITQVS